MKVITFNANGIRAARQRGFYSWLSAQDADFVCIQETKAQESNINGDEVYFPPNYYSEYFAAEKKGYSGVAIYARCKPQSIIRGFGANWCDQEGRYIQFDYVDFTIISVYFPSGTSGEQRQALKYDFLNYFAKHLLRLKKSKSALIICGDYNIAHKPIDLKNWRANQKHSGFLPRERAWMDSLVGELGFVDAFRVINQESEQYTWWSYRHPHAFTSNIGWRIDYQVITPGLVNKVKNAVIYREARFSDHAPLMIEYQDISCLS